MATTTITKSSPQDITTSILDPAYKPSPGTYNFAFNDFLKREYRFGIEKSRPICKSFQEGHCPLGNACPDKHVSTRIRDVCKHWLKGLCKRGDQCEFLHEYNIRRMPECTHYARSQTCPNGDDCLYQHIEPISKLGPCPHYERGFCPLGPKCGRSHVRRTFCPFYLAGFCPDGRTCKRGAHSKWQPDEALAKPVSKNELTAQHLEMEKAREAAAAERGDDRDRDGDRDGWRRDGGGKRNWRGGGGGGGRDRRDRKRF